MSSYTHDIEYTKLSPSTGASIASSSFNLINTILGAGILTVPYQLSKTGWVLGLFLHIATALVSKYSFVGLCTGQELAFSFDFQVVIQKVLGRVAGAYSSFSLLVFTSFVMISFCVILKDNLFFVEGWFKVGVMWAVLLFTMFPLSLVKDINGLWITSFLAIICVTYIFLFLVITAILSSAHVIDLGIERPDPIMFPTSIIKFIQALAGFSLCYAGHFNTLNIYSELRDKSLKKMQTISGITSYSVLILNLGIGLGGYFIFTQNVSSDILKNIELISNSTIKYCGNVANISIMIVMVCSFPLLCFCFRTTVNGLVLKNTELKYKHQILVVVPTVLTCGIIATFVSDIGIVLDIASAIAGIPLVLVFPCFLKRKYLQMLIKIDPEEVGAEYRKNARKQLMRMKIDQMFSCAVGIAGVLIIFVGIAGSVLQIVGY
ncbi:Amino_acid transporter [Hexamita inflata]|uniref:Putative n=1 Tax=Hexamita inflata TaxID=28002 RepID=A0AA86UXI2_9EUKA|nr:Amino acid transporter [Hexamita inflata]